MDPDLVPAGGRGDRLQEAIDAAVGGDEILLNPGTYRENTYYHIDGKVLTVRSLTGPADTILDGSLSQDWTLLWSFGSTTAGPVVEGLSFKHGAHDVYPLKIYRGNSTVRNCVFEDNASDPGSGVPAVVDRGSAAFIDCRFSRNTDGAVTVSRGSASFERCLFEDNTGRATLTASAIGTPSHSISLTDCIFRGNVRTPGLGSGGGAISLGHQGLSLQIDRCTFVENDAGSRGGAIHRVWGGAGGWVRNSLFVRNTATQGGAIALEDGTTLDISNSTFVDNTGRAIWQENSQSTVTNSILRNNGPSEVQGNVAITYSNVMGGSAGTGNIDADPMFVDALNDDYRLLASSPCIDAGDTGFWAALAATTPEPLDLLGFARAGDVAAVPNTGFSVLGMTVDMGAYERPALCLGSW